MLAGSKPTKDMIGPLAYIGGKRRLAAQIIALLPPHVTYVEPFAGGAQVFFQKPPSRVEVLNDLDAEVVNFLRVCQSHAPELARWLRYAVSSRRLFDLFATQAVDALTDVQRAARFLYLQKNCFGGMRRKRAYGYVASRPTKFPADRLPSLLNKTAARLAQTQLENRPYEEVLKAFDRPTTLFYCDPPYVGRRLYAYNFADSDFEPLADRLARLRGMFLLSINDTPLSREIFGRFRMREVSLAYGTHGLSPRVTELLVSNFALPPSPAAAPNAASSLTSSP
jgi:DNA adenine methylase